MGWDWSLVLMPYGPRFSVHRRIVQQQFQLNVVTQSYQPIITRETRLLLANLADNPADFVQHLKRYFNFGRSILFFRQRTNPNVLSTAGAIIMMIAYGHKIAPQGDEFVSLAEEARDVALEMGNPGTYLVDILPFRAYSQFIRANLSHIFNAVKYVPEWFPGANFKTQAREWRSLADDMRERPYRMVIKQIVSFDFPRLECCLREGCSSYKLDRPQGPPCRR
jgi:hypothetical protein